MNDAVENRRQKVFESLAEIHRLTTTNDEINQQETTLITRMIVLTDTMMIIVDRIIHTVIDIVRLRLVMIAIVVIAIRQVLHRDHFLLTTVAVLLEVHHRQPAQHLSLQCLERLPRRRIQGHEIRRLIVANVSVGHQH